MKISTLRENITGSEKNCKNKYVHETRIGKRYLDSGIDFIQGWCVFEGTPSYNKNYMYGCNGFTVGEFMQAIEEGLIKTELTDEAKEKLNEFKDYSLGISVLLYCFPVPALICFVLTIALIAVTRYISLGSMFLLTSFSVLVSLTYQGEYRLYVIIWSVLLAVICVARHHANIGRLLKGTENKLRFKSK